MKSASRGRFCPTPAKVRFGSERDARICMVKQALSCLRRGDKLPERVYQCACGGWHITSRAAWQVG